MTSFEQSLLRCVEKVQAGFPSTFTIDGHATVFTGVISEEPNVMQFVAGGQSTDGSITIEATRAQFVTADVTPVTGSSVIFGGRRYVITGMPGLNSDPTSYRMTCEAPQKARGR